MDTRWIDIDCMSVNIGDVLRVKVDAYSGNAGNVHNGRIVKVISVKDGDVHVVSIDYKTPYLANARHAPYRLERKVHVDASNS